MPNSLVPELLKLEGWEEQVELTEKWLKGEFEIPEIQDKWRKGPVINVALEVPDSVAPGEKLPVRVVMTANKVGHDFPTGPLDIIQSWIEMHIEDQEWVEAEVGAHSHDIQFEAAREYEDKKPVLVSLSLCQETRDGCAAFKT